MTVEHHLRRGPHQSIAIIQRRRWVIALCVALTAAVALALSVSQTPSYDATAKLQIIKSAQVLLGDATSSNPAGLSDFDPDTGQSLASLRVVAESASRRLSGRVSADEIRGSVTVDTSAQAGLVLVTAANTDPHTAAAVATEFAASFAAFARETAQETYANAARLVRNRINSLRRSGVTDSAQVSRLREQLDNLVSSESLQTGGLTLAERASAPGSPSSPKPLRNTLVGAIIGLLIGLGFAFVLEALDSRIRTVEEFEDLFDAPVLGQIPDSDALRRQDGTVESLPVRDAEAFRLLRSSFRYVQGTGNAKTIIVTSSTSGEGKSTVAWNLALTAAESHSRVLLIEADMRRPQFRRRYLFGSSSSGLSEVLSGQVTFDKAVIDYDHLRGVNGHGRQHGRLSVLVAGAKPPNPADLLESEAMETLLKRYADRFDLIIVDSPPPSVVADPLALFPLVDGTLVVGRIDFSDRRELERLRAMLDSLGARTLGLVINGTEPKVNVGYYE